MGHDKGKQLEDSTWVRKAPAKEEDFDLSALRKPSWKPRRASRMPPL